MSLVEKALAKLQTAGQRVQDKSITSAPANLLIGQLTSVPLTEPFVTATIITLDEQALQVAGMLPEERDAMGRNAQFRRVKWKLLDSIQDRRANQVKYPGTMVVTSSIAGEGKTFTSFNLALSLAREQGGRVILVDGDVAKRHITDVLSLQDHLGLIDYVVDPSVTLRDVLVKTNYQNLYILPAGKLRQGTDNLLASSRMEGLVSELAGPNSSDIILFDSAPMLLTNFAQVLVRLAPQIIFVVSAGQTPQSVVREALDMLDPSKVAIVLNQAQATVETEAYYHEYEGNGKD